MGRPITAPGLLASLALVAFPAAAQQEGIRTERLLQQGVTYPAPDQAGEAHCLTETATRH